MHSTPVPPRTLPPHLLADVLGLSVLFVTPRHFQNIIQTCQGEKANAIKQPIMTAAGVHHRHPSDCRAQEWRPRKAPQPHLFGYYLPQLGDDDLLFSMRLFKDTSHVLGNEQPRFKNMKKPCLISFDIFRPPFCDGLIHGLLSIRLSLSTKDAQKICSNTFFTFKPYNPSNQGVGQQPLHLQQRPRVPLNKLKNTINAFFPTTTSCGSGRSSSSSSRTTSSPTRTTRMSTTSTRGEGGPQVEVHRECTGPEWREEAPPPGDGWHQAH